MKRAVNKLIFPAFPIKLSPDTSVFSDGAPDPLKASAPLNGLITICVGTYGRDME